MAFISFSDSIVSAVDLDLGSFIFIPGIPDELFFLIINLENGYLIVEDHKFPLHQKEADFGRTIYSQEKVYLEQVDR